MAERVRFETVELGGGQYAVGSLTSLWKSSGVDKLRSPLAAASSGLRVDKAAGFCASAGGGVCGAVTLDRSIGSGPAEGRCRRARSDSCNLGVLRIDLELPLDLFDKE